MLAVPGLMPVTTPVEPIDTLALLVHVPPVVASLKLIVAPGQTLNEAAEIGGVVLTFTTAVEKQPVMAV